MKLEEKYLRMVKTILAETVPGCMVLAFGSRVNGNPSPWSDVDLVVKPDKPLTGVEMFHLREAFTESDLPMRVDVSQWGDLSEDFQQRITAEHEVLQPA